MIAFNISKPWREYFYTNIPLTVFIVLTLAYNQILIFWEKGSWNLLYASVFLPSNKLKFGALGVSWGFCSLILGVHFGLMKPFSSWLIRKYPRIKWLWFGLGLYYLNFLIKKWIIMKNIYANHNVMFRIWEGSLDSRIKAILNTISFTIEYFYLYW